MLCMILSFLMLLLESDNNVLGSTALSTYASV